MVHYRENFDKEGALDVFQKKMWTSMNAETRVMLEKLIARKFANKC